jgi:hypothetical protein
MNKLPLLERFIDDLSQIRQSAPGWSAIFEKYGDKMAWPGDYRPAHYWDLDYSKHRYRHVLNAVDVFMCETLDFGSPGQWTDLSLREGNFELASCYRKGARGELLRLKPPKKEVPREYRFVIAWTGREYDYWLHLGGLRQDLGPTPPLWDATLFLWLEWKNRVTLEAGSSYPPQEESTDLWYKLLTRVL